MTPDATRMDGLADRFLAAIERGDLATLRTLYAPDAMIWHCAWAAEQNVEDNLRLLGRLTTVVQDLRYEEIRRTPSTEGFVERHVLRGRLPDGSALEVPACLFVTVDADERVVRIEEYADSRCSDGLRTLLRGEPDTE